MYEDQMSANERIRTIAPFGELPLPEGLQVCAISIPEGSLTALHASVEPTSTRKGTVLFVPGFTGSKEDFYTLFPLLAIRGWDLWAYSQRGQADSFAPKGIESYGRERMANDLLEVASIISQRVGEPKLHLLGHSFGGTVAQAAAICNPQRFKSLALMSSGPHGWPGRKADIRERLEEANGVDLWRLDNPDRADVPDCELDDLDRFFRLRSQMTSTDQLIGAIDQLARVEDTTFQVKATGLPVLIFHGSEDVFAWPQNWQQRMAIILGCSYATIPDSGHCPDRENPLPTADLLDDFWSQH